MNKRMLLIFLILFCTQAAISQDDLLGELEEIAEEELFVYPAFKAMKIANLQSTKVANKGDLYMYVSHRFGSLEDGIETFFGLDNAHTKIQMLYGVADGLQMGISRESFRKTYAGHVKWRVMQQNQNFPLTVAAYSIVNLNTQLKETQYPFLKYADRLSYATQLLVSRRVNDRLSIEIAPTFVRQNLVFEKEQDHSQYALGMGFRYKITKRMSINLDYVYNMSRWEGSAFRDPLSIGIDIETGGHVFQLLFTNSQSTNEPSFISDAEGDWSGGTIYFGFNIVRAF